MRRLTLRARAAAVSLALVLTLAGFTSTSVSATPIRSSASLIALSPACLQPGSDPSTTDPAEATACLRTMAADTSSQRLEVLLGLCLALLVASAMLVLRLMAG